MLQRQRHVAAVRGIDPEALARGLSQQQPEQLAAPVQPPTTLPSLHQQQLQQLQQQHQLQQLQQGRQLQQLPRPQVHQLQPQLH